MSKTVTGIVSSETWSVDVGKTCKVKKSYWYNGEGWYKLEDIQTGELFDSPDIFWE